MKMRKMDCAGSIRVVEKVESVGEIYHYPNFRPLGTRSGIQCNTVGKAELVPSTYPKVYTYMSRFWVVRKDFKLKLLETYLKKMPMHENQSEGPEKAQIAGVPEPDQANRSRNSPFF